MERGVAAAEVDLLLVLAMDASGSLSDARITLQRQGHAGALVSPDFLEAVRAGEARAVGVTAVEWSDAGRQRQVVPWKRVADHRTAQDFATALLAAPRPIPGFTSISGALDYSARLLAAAPYRTTRRVIDVSGNGVNNSGREPADARDDAVAQGIVINGLPIIDSERELGDYFAREVIGGPGAFLVVANDLAGFALAIRRKLLLEVA